MESSDRYQSPLQARYASRPMQELWSDRNRFTTWRRLWLALARGQQALGLDITDAQLEALPSSSSTPAHCPEAKSVAPQNRRIPTFPETVTLEWSSNPSACN
ncbi:MAG: hypothetical protein VX727_03505, partial [Planctomycetota bacterium]|nr:hypothetical protein [Planctomycetota bacterium]